jgi:hypothetical protein
LNKLFKRNTSSMTDESPVNTRNPNPKQLSISYPGVQSEISLLLSLAFDQMIGPAKKYLSSMISNGAVALRDAED